MPLISFVSAQATARRRLLIAVTSSMTLLTLLPNSALGQRVAPMAVVSGTPQPYANRSLPALIEPENRRRFVISATVGGIAGAAAGFYMAHSEASHSGCPVSAGNGCTETNHYLAYSAIGAILGALMGIVVGGSD